MIDNKLAILLGLIGTGYAIHSLCQEEEDEFVDNRERSYEYYPEKNNVNYSKMYESSQKVAMDEDEMLPSPLAFSTMIEPYVESDYVAVEDISKSPGNIPVYNANDGSISLPVGDMTDLSTSDAAKNNKYVFDRTFATIGFTSSKIGGPSRGQADFIRGDLPIIPQNTGWFQVSSNPVDKLMQGAMNLSGNVGISNATVENKIGLNQESGTVSGSGQRSMSGRSEPTLQDLIEEKAESEKKMQIKGGGGQRAMASSYASLPSYTVADLQNAKLNETKTPYGYSS
jgi:hypothetical protein